jgi:hypothetical protein
VDRKGELQQSPELVALTPYSQQRNSYFGKPAIPDLTGIERHNHLFPAAILQRLGKMNKLALRAAAFQLSNQMQDLCTHHQTGLRITTR